MGVPRDKNQHIVSKLWIFENYSYTYRKLTIEKIRNFATVSNDTIQELQDKRMILYKQFRLSKPSEKKVPAEKVDSEYRRLRSRTFWGVTVSYCLFYVCRMTLNVVKQPMIDEGIFSPGQLGIIGSAMLWAYAFGKFTNGFVADYCNIRKFMGFGLAISSIINILLFVCGIVPLHGAALMILFVLLFTVNGWVQSMGSPPAVISLSRWFPLETRGRWYSIMSSSPYIGKFLTFNLIGFVVGWSWQAGFLIAGLLGLVGVFVIAIFVSDTPESCGLPPIREYAAEAERKEDRLPTRELQKMILRHPGIWVIALSSAFIYIAQYAVSNWGILFLQKSKGFSLMNSANIIAFAEASGVIGTVLAGWLSDKVFKGNRAKPVIIAGLLSLASLSAFLFTQGSSIENIIYVSIFSMSIGSIFCLVAGLMAMEMVPRKATGAALGIVGISSYVAAGIQDIVSGYMIQGFGYDFGPASIFWVISCALSFILPVIGWKKLS